MIKIKITLENYQKFRSHFAHTKACEFHDCVNLLFAESNSPCVRLSAKIVNAAIATELFLKSMLISYGIGYAKNHELARLFDLLPSEVKSHVVFLMNISDEEFIRNLEGVSKSYNTWRYTFENPGPDRGAYIINLDFLLSLLKCCHRASTDVQNKRGSLNK